MVKGRAGLAVLGAMAAGRRIVGAMGGRGGRHRGLSASLAGILIESVEGGPEARAVTDPDGGLAFGNRMYREVAPGDGACVPAVLPWKTLEDREKVERLGRSVAVGVGAGEEVCLEGRDAGRRWFVVSAHPVDNAPGYAMWYLTDVTNQHEMREAARQEEEIRTDFLDNAPVGYYSVDKDGKFLFVNNTLAGILGFTPYELVRGRIVIDDLRMQAAPRPAEAGDGIQRIREILKTRDGDPVPMEVIEAVERDAAGEILRTRSVVRDLRGEYESAEALRRAEARFERFFEDAPVGIALVESSGKVIEANGAFYALAVGGKGKGDGRVKRNGTAHHNLFDLIVDEDREEVSSLVQNVALGRRQAGTAPEVRFVSNEGMSSQLYVNRVGEETGVGQGLVLHLVDTTELKKLEVQIVQSQKMQAVGQLAGGIAHDFNNLLTAILGFCDLLLLRHQPGDPSFADIMQVKQNSNRAANLVRQLLAFSRQQTLRPTVLRRSEVLAELSNLIRRLIGEKIELKMVHGRKLGLVKADQGQMEQVLINLAVNARDAMAGGGTLTITTSNYVVRAGDETGGAELAPGGYVLVEVADTGVGIDEDVVEKIFEPFYTTKGVGEGTGLGLSTVYGIIQQTGGNITVASVLGRGTVFSIYLPRHEPEKEAAPAGLAAAAPEAATDLTGKETILLVEDEDPVRAFACRALRNKGYTVLEAGNGEAALDVIRGHEGVIELVISDVVMPAMDGPTLIRETRLMLGEVKCILISGYAEDEFRKQMAEEDFVFLSKPFTLKQLAGTVKEVLAGNREGRFRAPPGC